MKTNKCFFKSVLEKHWVANTPDDGQVGNKTQDFW